MKTRIFTILAVIMIISLAGCDAGDKKLTEEMKASLAKYKEVTLITDLDWLSSQEREIISICIDVADIIDDIFWMEAYGDKEELLGKTDNECAKEFVKINYGPWDRLNNDTSFIPGIGAKRPGAQFYPPDMTAGEFESWDNPDKTSLYTIIKRDTDGKLIAVPYSEAFRNQHSKAAELMLKAADLAEDAGLKKYLKMRAYALLSDRYQPSDFAWMEMKKSNIDFVVGPIENYEDRLNGYKAAHESFVLVKDTAWSAKLMKFNAMLPGLQAGLPVAPEYKAEMPGTDADMMIDESQRKYITFDAFFENTTFHEVAHGRANMLSMKYFADNGAFLYLDNGYYKVNFEEMKKAVESLVGKMLSLQGNGDYEGVKTWIENDGVMSETLRRDLDKVNAAGIPVDIVFNQGKEVLGL